MGVLIPVMLRLTGRTCVIIGGGAVAARKAAALLEAEARVTIISPVLHPTLQTQDEITLLNQPYSPGILADLKPFLVFAATDNPAINQQAASEAHQLGALVDTVDSADNADFMNMSVLRRGAITIALSTGGASPALTAHLREKVSAAIGDEYAVLTDWMAGARPQVKTTVNDQQNRQNLWHDILNSPILEHLHLGHLDAARILFDQYIAAAQDNHS